MKCHSNDITMAFCDLLLVLNVLHHRASFIKSTPKGRILHGKLQMRRSTFLLRADIKKFWQNCISMTFQLSLPSACYFAIDLSAALSGVRDLGHFLQANNYIL